MDSEGNIWAVMSVDRAVISTPDNDEIITNTKIQCLYIDKSFSNYFGSKMISLHILQNVAII